MPAGQWRRRIWLGICQRSTLLGAEVAVRDVDAKAGEDIVRQIGAGGGTASDIEADLAHMDDIEVVVALTLHVDMGS